MKNLAWIPKSTLLPFALFAVLCTHPLHAEDEVIESDVVLIGGGVMSATLGALLNELDPTLKISIFERLPGVAAESSAALNNAGTGHSALAELNYTPELEDDTIDITKAVDVMKAFEISKGFWGYLASRGTIGDPQSFIHSVPHMSWVHGEEDVAFLRKRYAALHAHPLFAGMEYSEDPAKLAEWMPGMMKGRAPGEVMAATRSNLGTDVDFGKLSREMLDRIVARGAHLYLGHETRDLQQDASGRWRLTVWDSKTERFKDVRAKFLFIGAGGGALPLLQKSGIPEAKGYGGFPISGQFLMTTNPELIALHDAKVYGKAPEGSPPMSVPHLDTRVIDGKRVLIFGPFAGATTKFLKKGSLLDLLTSIQPENLGAMLKSAYQNVGLLKYLTEQVTMTHASRMRALREFMPEARDEDWKLIDAGQRVQIIKDDPNEDENVLRFGTEVVTSADGTLAALLGASPGASTSVAVMLKLLEKCFPAQMKSAAWKQKLLAVVPGYNFNWEENVALASGLRSAAHRQLGLRPPAIASYCEGAGASLN